MTYKKLDTEYWWLIFIVIAAIIRLVITGDRDIIAMNSPHDEFWYIHTAYNWIWGGQYDQMAIVHLPIYSMWLDFLRLFGIPARLAIDVGWLISAGYLAFATNRLTNMGWTGALVFTFLAFHPYTISLFDRALAETLLTVISAAIIGAGIELWNCREACSTFRRRLALVVYIVGFAIAFHTRKEGIVLIAPLLVLACWSLFERRYFWSNKNRQRVTLPLLIYPLLATLVLGFLISGGNYLKYGVMVRHDLAAKGYQRAIGALNSIDVGRTPKHFTITDEVLSQAYEASTTFMELKPAMDGRAGKMWKSISSRETGVLKSIGNGWFYWALRDAAAQAGWHRNAQMANSKYMAVADELEKAFLSGKLKGRSFHVSSFLDPDYGKWLSDLPNSFLNILQLVVLPKLQYLEFPKENAGDSQFSEYVTITGRRGGIGPFLNKTQVSAWSILPEGSLVGFKGEEAKWVRLSGKQRPDVKGAYGFVVTSMSKLAPLELRYLTPDGRRGHISLNDLNTGSVSFFSGDRKVAIGVDNLITNLDTNFKRKRADQWWVALCKVYEYLGYILSVLILCSAFLIIYRRKSLTANSVVIIVLFSAILARVSLFSIVDASSFSALQVRYILPVISVFACLGVLGFAFLFCSPGKIK